MNRTMAKKELDDFIADLVERFGAAVLAAVLDTIKTLGFHNATLAGITISKNDIVIPPEKEEILAGYEERVAGVIDHFERGLITEGERHEQVTEIWTEATDTVAAAMEKTLYELNPIFMMANSGARGSFKQIRQLAGMRGLMANPKGEIIERPIKANFMEGLSVLEYFISTHGARKGLADTALRTADSGYLTRRLVDVAQDVIIRDEDCKTKEFITVPLFLPDGPNRSAAGRVLATDVYKPLKDGKPGKTKLAAKGEEVTTARMREIIEELGELAREMELPVRSVLKCKSDFGMCRTCYGTFLGTGELAEVGDAVGHHGRAVDRRARHAADDADVPHGRCGRRRHHARPPAGPGDLRGSHAARRGTPRRGRRDRPDRARRPWPEGVHPARRRRQGRDAGARGVPAAAADAPARRERPARRARRRV